MKEIYISEEIYIVRHESEVPWLKIFSYKDYKELTDCDEKTKNTIYKAIEIIEKTMLDFYKPEKINIAMFGNYIPHFHVHVMARFENDSYYPEPMWGERQRDGNLNLPPFMKFLDKLKLNLTSL